jgi:hypothetical protein
VNVERRVESHGQTAHHRFRCLECGADLGRGHKSKAGRHAATGHSEIGRVHIVEPLSDAQREALLAALVEKRRQREKKNTQRRTAKRRQVSQGREAAVWWIADAYMWCLALKSIVVGQQARTASESLKAAPPYEPGGPSS